YRYIVAKGADKFAKFAARVWGIDPSGKSEAELADAGIDALAAFIKEIGMPSNFRELGIPADLPWKEIADSVTLTPGGYGHLTHEDVLKIFEACK
ncbi:MAG: iron-containing alcohol dehydrogenase, partial [Oscillibacter sp.]|nr:iron-containing alcohol dehydrogenase [Oscillibacter sp.]